jgi:hypothetical protein
MIGKIQYVNLSELPREFQDELWPKLSINGGNVISVESDSSFGSYLQSQGFVFDMPRVAKDKTWAWLVVFR